MADVSGWIARDAAWIGLGEDPAAARRLLAPVGEAYAEPQRHYHDQTHLAEMLDAVHALRPRCRDFRAVVLAAWFHDAVYQPERSDNEARSAAWAVEALGAAGFPAELASAVEALVRGTEPGTPLPEDPDAQVLWDADRRVWAAAAPRYAEYARGIRAEYRRFPWTAYAAGRRGFLRRALQRAAERGRLFFHLGPAADEAARLNLAREIRCLAWPRVPLARLRRRDPLAGLG